MEGLRDQVAANKQDISDLKSEVSNLKTRVAVAENNINAVFNKLDKIDSNTSKLLWIVIGAVVGGLLKLLGLF